MDQQKMIEQYLESLKAMGLTDEAIALYKQQMEQSMQFSSQWTQQLQQFGQNMQTFNQLFTGDPGAANDDQPDEDYAIVLNPGTTLTPKEQWAIACGADIAFLNGQFLNDLTTGLGKPVCRQLLSEWWDIDSKEELEEMITWLFNEGHRIHFDIIWQAMNTVSIKESKAFLREYVIKNEMEEEVMLQRLRNMRDALELFNEHKLINKDTQPEMLIWDYARIINISRAGFDAGYFTRAEAFDKIMHCVTPVRKMYSSWKQLSVSYQFARCVWNGLDGNDFDSLKQGMDILLTDPQSPWVTLPWEVL